MVRSAGRGLAGTRPGLNAPSQKLVAAEIHEFTRG